MAQYLQTNNSMTLTVTFGEDGRHCCPIRPDPLMLVEEDQEGTLWLAQWDDDEEPMDLTQVNYCLACGYKAPVQAQEVPYAAGTFPDTTVFECEEEGGIP